MRDGSPRAARESGRLRLGVSVLQLDGRSQDEMGTLMTRLQGVENSLTSLERKVACFQMCSSGGTFSIATVNVSATDKSTGKKQSITIRSSGGLSDADVEKMVQEFQEQLSNTDDRMATMQKSITELEDSAVKTTER